MRRFTLSLLAATLLASTASAGSIAITNAHIFTGTKKG